LAPVLLSAQAGPLRQADSTLAIMSAELQDAITLADTTAVADVRLRLVPIGDYNVAVSVVRRSQVDGRTPPDAIVHDAITEVYEIREGRGILVVGGVLDDPHPFPAESPVVRGLIGPSARGTTIHGGIRREVGPGDIVVIPPRTPHGFAELLTPKITYVIVRIDGDRVLRQAP
jgi:mannose-6-phosphate isomerase-like protein (cupin superfamily)